MVKPYRPAPRDHGEAPLPDGMDEAGGHVPARWSEGAGSVVGPVPSLAGGA